MNFLERQLEDPIRLKRIKYGFYIVLVVAVLAECALAGAQELWPDPLVSEHYHFPFESFPFWGSLYGLVSCVAIIVVSKFLGKVWLMRREDYYESDS